MDYKKWLLLMHNLGLTGNKNTYDRLLQAYSEKHRYYHNKCHIDAVLKHLENCILLAGNPYEVELALWFHDAIYKPSSSSNELDSANFACSFLKKNGGNKQTIDNVHNLVMATIHSTHPANGDASLIVDIDLSILGCSEDIYAKFESNIRKEYKMVPSFIYKKKRKELLTRFINRERIYTHSYFYEKLESQARLNINNAIQNL